MATILPFTIFGTDKGSGVFDDVADSADHAADRMDNLSGVSAKVFAAMTVSALGAGVAVGGALVGASAGFALIGGIAAAQSPVVQDAAKSMADSVKANAKDMSAPMALAMADILSKTESTFLRVRGTISSTMEDSAEQVEILADGVLGLTERALPGMATAAERATPAFGGLRNMLYDTGDGVNEFFTETSEGAESAGRIFDAFGDIVRDALGFAGGFLADLANEGAPSVEKLASVLGKLLDIAGQVGGGAFPVLFSAAGAVLGVLDSILGVVQPLAGGLGTVVGVVLSLSLALKTISMLNNFGVNVGQQFAAFGKAASGAGTNVGGLATRVGGLAGFLAGPWGAALGVATFLLADFMETQNKTEQATEDLTNAFKQSKGAIDDNVRAVAANNLQQSGALEMASKLGIPLSKLVDAYLNVGSAQKEVLTNLDEIRNKYAIDDPTGAVGIDATAEAALNLSTILGDLAPGMDEARRKGELYADAMDSTASATDSAAEASRRRQQALAAEQMQVLAGIDAEFAYEASLRGVESAAFGVKDATDEYNKTVAEKGKTSREAAEADLQLRDATGQLDFAIRQAIISAGEFAVANSTATDEAEKNRIAVDASNREALRMASTWSGPLPAALVKTIGSMDATTLAALGVTRSVDSAGAAVYRLPGGKTVVLSAVDQASPSIRNVQNSLNQISRAPIIVTLALRVSGDPKRLIQSATNYIPRASGGPVRANDLLLVGEEGPEFMVPQTNGYVIPADLTAQMRTAMAGGWNGGTSGPMPRSVASAAANRTTTVIQVVANFNGPVGDRRQVENWVAQAVDSLTRKGRIKTP